MSHDQTPARAVILKDLAKALREAERTCEAIRPVSRQAELTLADAYAIQIINIEERLAEGQVITGKKIGLTSKAMQDLLGVSTPDFGHLMDAMAVSGNRIERNELLQPKVEGEVSFVLKKDLMGPNVTAQEVLDATDYVVASIEVVDSRITDWKINILDTVADNASASRYVLGEKRVDPRTVDLKKLTMDLFINGQRINGGIGTDVLGDPSNCVAWLANQMAQFGVSLKAGEIVMSGALSAAVPVQAGDLCTVEFSELGACSVRFV